MEAKDLIEEIRVIQKDVDYRKSKLRGGYDYDFSDYKTFKELFKGLYYKNCTIDEAEREQDEVNAIIGVFEDYTPKNNKYIEAKNKILNKVKKNKVKNFLAQGLGSLLEKLRMSKNNSERNKIQVGLINSGLGDLKKAIEDMSEEETEIESPN